MVPKKYGMTIVKIKNDELVPTRVQNSLRVCINYRKLNQAIGKDYFPLPFINQVLETLAEYQHKTTFTCPFDTFAYTMMSFSLCNTPSTF
ncbi:hypothetical protein CR513_27027, partial [Mucuna pruriens]